jgi:hypothetical protein
MAPLSVLPYPTGKSPMVACQEPLAKSSSSGKNILLFRSANHSYIHSRPVPLKGALAIVTTRGGMRWTRMVLLTRVSDADGEDVWS